MAAIITEKFRQHNAEQFYESFSEASKSTYYLFVGKATAFTSGTTGGSDSSPPTPADGPSDTEFYAWDSMLAAKNITSSDIEHAVRRVGVKMVTAPILEKFLYFQILNLILFILSFAVPITILLLF